MDDLSNSDEEVQPLSLAELEATFKEAAGVLQEHLEADMRAHRAMIENANPTENGQDEEDLLTQKEKSSDGPNGKPITARQREREQKKMETAVKQSEENRVLRNRLHAVIQENPYRYKAGSKLNHQAWENIAKVLVRKNLLEDTPAARLKMQKKVSTLLTNHKKVYKTRPTGDEPPPMDETDRLVAEIDKLKESGVFQKPDPKVTGGQIRKSIALIGMRTAVRIRDLSNEDDNEEEDPMENENVDENASKESGTVGRFARSDFSFDLSEPDLPPNVPRAEPPIVLPKRPAETPKGSAEKKKPPPRPDGTQLDDKPAEKPIRMTRDRQLMGSFEAIAGSIGKMNEMQEKVWKEEREEIIQERLAAAQRFREEQGSKAREKEKEREERAKDREFEKEQHSVMVNALTSVLTAAFAATKPT